MNAAAGSIPVALRAPYIDPATKQHNSELIAPPGLSKQWGPLQSIGMKMSLQFNNFSISDVML